MPRHQPQRLVGESSALADVLDQVSQVAPLSRPILIIGERGTGKELIAERMRLQREAEEKQRQLEEGERLRIEELERKEREEAERCPADLAAASLGAAAARFIFVCSAAGALGRGPRRGRGVPRSGG